MSGFELHERINRPHDFVWRYFADTDNVRAWMPDIVRSEKLTDGPVGLGSRFRETRLIDGNEHTVTLEVTEFDEGRRYAGTFEEKGLRATYTYTFTPSGEGTEVPLVADVSGSGFMKLMVPMVRRQMKKLDGDQLTRLKQAIENS